MKMISQIVNLSFLILILLVTLVLFPSSYSVLSFPTGITDPFRLQIPQIWFTISAQTRTIEISWINARLLQGDKIFITNSEPKEFRKVFINDFPNLSSDSDKNSFINDSIFNIYNNDDNGSGNGFYGIIPISINNDNNNNNNKNNDENWECNKGDVEILEIISPKEPSQWIQTSLKYDYKKSDNVTINTKCYGLWASYVDINGKIISIGCIKAYPTWMNDMRQAIGQFRIRDLFIPGTHDSGSYRKNFKPSKRETIVTKYSLTQDDDIRAQLMHGIRYFDIRIGYYKNTLEKFFINHGIAKQIPLKDALIQIRDYILETNEIVIFDVQEFPVGFGKDLVIHRKLVQYIYTIFKDLLISPELSWQIPLYKIWERKQNIFLSYDHSGVVAEFPSILFQACQHRWGNVKKWSDLEKYLRRVNTYDMLRLSSRPVSDMAQLTADTFGIIIDKHGGLRKMADQVNSKVSKLYREDLGSTANIVSVDFYRGTTVVDLAIYFNYEKVIL